MDKKLNTRDSELLRKVRVLKLSDNWPFRSVSADEFVKASTPLIEMLRNSDDRLIGNKNASPEMYMDRTIEATIIMLRCVHKMQFEASSREMDAMIKGERDRIYDVDFFDAYEFAEYAYDEMCEYNNRICDNLADDLRMGGLEPAYMYRDYGDEYLIDEERGFVEQAADNHYVAMKRAYDNVESLIQHGMPAENVFARIVDMISGNANIKSENKEIVDDILNAEAIIEMVGLHILPELNRKIKECEAQAIIETLHTKDENQLKEGDIQQTDPHFFRKEYERYVAAKDAIERALLIMQKDEFKLENDYRLIVDRDPKTATYVLTAQWSRGDSGVKHKSKQLSDNIQHNKTVVKVKDREEKSVEIKVGRASKKLYEETKKRSACKLGYMNRQELKMSDKAFANTLSADIMRKEIVVHRKTKVAGKKMHDAKFAFDVARVGDDVTYECNVEDNGKQKKEIISASADIGSISAKSNTSLGVPIVGASIEAAGAKASVLEKVKVRTKAASIHCDVGAVVSQVIDGIGDNIAENIGKEIGDAGESAQIFPPDGAEVQIAEDAFGAIADGAVDMSMFKPQKNIGDFHELQIDSEAVIERDR